MQFRIKPFNKVSTSSFGDGYICDASCEAPDAIVVRSAPIDTELFGGLLAVARAGAGFNNITVDKATEKGICVFNTPGANANAVSELVFTALGMYMRHIPESIRFLNALKGKGNEAVSKEVEKGKSQFSGNELYGKTMGVIGLGKIGVRVANAALSRGMRVIGYEPYPDMDNMLQLSRSVALLSGIEDVLGKSDVVSIHIPLLPTTKGMFNVPMLSSAKMGCILVNFARAEICNEDSVIAALGSGRLGGYLTDFPTDRLIGLDKVLCTPHLGASTEEAEENCARMATLQLKSYLELGVVFNSVNFPRFETIPAPGANVRLTAVHKGMKGLIGTLSEDLGDPIFVAEVANSKVSYTVMDFRNSVDRKKLSSYDGQVLFRVIEL